MVALFSVRNLNFHTPPFFFTNNPTPLPLPLPPHISLPSLPPHHNMPISTASFPAPSTSASTSLLPHKTTPHRTIILALSGPSSSGKTSLATALAALLPHCHILHLDDFYLPERELPRRGEVLDWDSAASFDLDALRRSCEWWKAGGEVFKPGVENGKGDRGQLNGGGELGEEVAEGRKKEDERGEGEEEKDEGGVEGEGWEGDGVHGGTMPAPGTSGRERLARVMARLKRSRLATSGSWGATPPPPHLAAHTMVTAPQPRLLILEGILLHTPAFAILQPLFDIKILLRASFAEAQRRREARGGYVTLEGFWEDPDGYFEEVVWRSYREGHEAFFQGGDVEGALRTEKSKGDRRWITEDEQEREGESEPATAACVINDIWVQPLGMDLAEGLEWVWGVLERELRGMMDREEEKEDGCNGREDGGDGMTRTKI